MQQKSSNTPSKITTWIEVQPTLARKDDTQNLKNLLVQTSEGEKIQKPDDDSFLGAQNQHFDQQTVSQNKRVTIGSEQNRMSKNSNTQTKHSKKDVNSERNQNPELNKVAPQKFLSKLGVPIQLPTGERSSDDPQWATPGTRPEDYIEGMKESDRTALNTREYLFYGYFQRVRERLDRAWVPILRKKLISYYRNGRQLANSSSHTTKLLVILNDRGEIIKVQLVGESGTRDLDEAAVSAFNKAGPFPNPPKGMMNQKREIRIPWDFILKT